MCAHVCRSPGVQKKALGLQKPEYVAWQVAVSCLRWAGANSAPFPNPRKHSLAQGVLEPNPTHCLSAGITGMQPNRVLRSEFSYNSLLFVLHFNQEAVRFTRTMLQC